jgi:hypothetical protein
MTTSTAIRTWRLALERLDEWNAALLARQRALAIVLKLPPGARGDLAAQSQLIARNLMLQRTVGGGIAVSGCGAEGESRR